jgi:hypothetical protein
LEILAGSGPNGVATAWRGRAEWSFQRRALSSSASALRTIPTSDTIV